MRCCVRYRSRRSATLPRCFELRPSPLPCIKGGMKGFHVGTIRIRIGDDLVGDSSRECLDFAEERHAPRRRGYIARRVEGGGCAPGHRSQQVATLPCRYVCMRYVCAILTFRADAVPGRSPGTVSAAFPPRHAVFEDTVRHGNPVVCYTIHFVCGMHCFYVAS